MSKSINAVVPIVIGKSPEWKVCKRSVLKYCKKYDLPLEIITKKKYDIKPFNPFSNSINLFEKNQIYELFDKYDRILRLDYDLIISPNCPNLFDIVPEDKVGGVFEDVGDAQLSRRKMIIDIQIHLGGNLNWLSGYMNAGVVVASKEHKEIFNTSIEEINRVQEIEGIATPEQDYFNYMIRKLGFEIQELNYKFNHIRYFSPDRFDSYIIHYAGSGLFDNDLQIKREKRIDNKLWRKMTAKQMKRDYKEMMRRSKNGKNK